LVLTIAHHPDPRFIGHRRVLLDDKPVVIGRRAECFGVGALDDRLLSRRHVELARDGDGVRVRDLDSHNGSHIDGERVAEGRLQPGQILGVGGILIVVHRGPAFFQSRAHDAIGGVSYAINCVLELIVRAAKSDVTVLIHGETGVGKELVARALHAARERKGAFVAINCATIPGGVLQSELFGHAKGAFSGAGVERTGLIGSAKNGTLLLDEIGDAPMELQTSLLRLLEQREYRPVGSDRTLTTDAHFVTASHVDLHAAVEAGSFRRDLLGRIDRWTITVPPLRERREDIIALALRFLKSRGREVAIDRALALALLRYDWPRNVRELQAVLEQVTLEQPDADVFALSQTIGARLKAPPAGEPPQEPKSVEAPTDPQRMRGRAPSAEHLRARFIALGGNVKALADEFGVGRNTLYRWFKKLDLDPDRLRDG
jgi:DNA-binding NtrC family response regulator